MNSFLPKRLIKYDTDSIIAEIKRVLKQHFDNKIPQMKDFNKYSRISNTTVFKFFGTWTDALEKAGYHLEEDMLKNLKEVSVLNNGKYFSYKFYKKNGGRYDLKILKKHLNCVS